MPTVNAIPSMGLLRRHGSAEQDNRGEGGTYLTSINTPRKTPRGTPRMGSPARLMDNDDNDVEEEEEYQARDSERKQSRRRMPTPSVGIPFRIRATEQSIKLLNNEVAAQRIMINQITEELQRQAVGKEAQDQRLNAVFAHVDTKFTEANNITQQIYDTAYQKFQVVTSAINSVAEGLAQRVEQMSMELEVVKRQNKEADHNATQSNDRQPQQPQTSAPPPPSSWTAPSAAGRMPQPTTHQEQPTNPPQFGRNQTNSTDGSSNANGNGAYGGPSAPAPQPNVFTLVRR